MSEDLEDTTLDAYPARGEVVEGKYEVQQILGTGAMGAVIKAHHLLRKVPVALKFVSPSILGQKDVIERFLNEGVASSKIDSEHVVKVFDVSKMPNGTPYLVMEYLEGEDLYRLLRREGKPYLPDLQRAIHFTLQILRGLQAAHRVGIVHRDMKPANCFIIRKEGEPDFIKIVDFGISKVRLEGELELTQANSALGTPLYMSLEQARSPKDVDARSDLYSVAVILYELLGGVTPFVPMSGTLMELFSMLAMEEPRAIEELRNDLPLGLGDILRKGLQKDPRRRYQTAEEFAEALAPFADQRSDHVVSLLLRTVNKTGRTKPPPAYTPSTPPAGTGSTGTLMMSSAPIGLPPTVRKDNVSSSALRSSDAPALLPPPETVANTAQGTVRETQNRTVLEERRGTPLVFAIAIVAVGAVAAAAWALGKVSSPTVSQEKPVAATSASPPAPVAPSPPTGEPNPLDARPSAVVSAPVPSATFDPKPSATAPATAVKSAKPTLKDFGRD
ncbi:MAG: serine/threonine protein kinase [Myxococcales bacterium]|nr:serine/threonine protein kinase [Myxococcales bacterium]